MKYIFIFWLCLYGAFCQAQQMPVHRQINVENGLLSNTIYDIKILKNQLLCIAHDRGLSTFDGVRFIHYPNKDFPNISVSNIMESTTGEIYCKSFANVFFKLNNDSLRLEFSLPADELFHYSQIVHNSIVGTYHDSIYFYSLNSKKLNYKTIAQSTDYNTLINVAYSNSYSSNDTIKNLIVIDSTLQYSSIPLLSKRNKPIVNYLASPSTYSSNRVGEKPLVNMASFYSINSFCDERNLFVNSIIQIDSIIWICTTTGAYAYSRSNGFLDGRNYFKKNNISSVQKDFENNYWFSTTSSGLLMIPNFEIRKLTIDPFSISCLQSRKGQLIVGTQTGMILSYNTKSQEITPITKSNFQKSIDAIIPIQDKLIFSSSNFYVYQKNKIYTEPFIIKDFTNWDDDIFIGANKSCYLYGTVKIHSWIQSFFDTKFKSSINHLHKLTFLDSRIISTAIDNRKQHLYILTLNGLYKIDSTLKTPTLLSSKTATVSKILFYNNTLYLAAKDKGLCIVDNGELKSIRLANSEISIGLIYNLYKHKGNFWIQSENGIFKYDGKIITSYNYSIGLPIRQIKGCHFIGDTVFCFTNDALLYFIDKDTKPQINQPRLVIQSIKSLKSTHSPFQKLNLAANDNNLTIEFSLIEYSNSLNSQVVYSLNNEEKIKLGNQVRTLNLPSLASGNYRLNLYPTIDGKVDEKNKTTILFSIATPFWKSWWFIALLLIIASGIVYTWVRHILLKQKKENRLIQSKLMLEKELDRSMLSSIKAQMNPHFLFNALNTIQSYIYSNEKKNASLYISKFSSLTRSILDMSTKDTISLEEEINALSLYLELEKMRFEESFNYTIQVAAIINKELVKIPSMLVQPYVENAIKHGLLHKKTNRILFINFSREDNLLKVVIDDNGIGRKRSAELNSIKNRQHTSFAMGANKKRLDILKNNFKNIEFEIVDKFSPLGEANGTKVIIRLPL